MSPYRCSRRRLIAACLLLPFALYIFSSGRYSVTFTGTVRGTGPLQVWEFVMDFNNAKRLNPTVLDFWLVSDSGGGSEWRYRLGYTEFLHQLPFITNQAVADFRCAPLKHDTYIIQSSHTTCFFNNLTCVQSLSEFTFQKYENNPQDTFCIEKVQYECPRILSSFCHNEVMFQRRSIFQNLDKILGNN